MTSINSIIHSLLIERQDTQTIIAHLVTEHGLEKDQATQVVINTLEEIEEVSSHANIRPMLYTRILQAMEGKQDHQARVRHLLKEYGSFANDDDDIENTLSAIMAGRNLHKTKKEAKEKLASVDDEIKEKVLFWRNNAFPNNEIIEKLIKKYQLPEDEAKHIVKTIHLYKSNEVRTEVKEMEKAVEHSNNKYIGAILMVVGVLVTICLFVFDEEGDFEDYIIYAIGLAISGFIQMMAGWNKRAYQND
ncbi:hypothetical protein [Microscilla marina]|uniref:Uncharacterized protein n=1 Tax=Microscilla marina ATCC 23134 TaxID=313606 RepID=A1ZIC7_MICM2|nr:hypothetical protein [Microscilla marina]EAY29795.1 hypothetical protein M23134_05667 [Microscilla marina ATCC 23134]